MTAPGDPTSVGAILVDSGLLRANDAEKILRLQKSAGLRFGDAAVELGLITEAQLQQALATQFDFPYLAAGRSDVSAELIAAFDPFSTQVQNLRALRTQLMLRWFDGSSERRAVALTSAARGEGRSWLAANLAVVFSQLGERTLLIDADLRHPRQHLLFNLDNGAGLSSVLSGRAENAVQRIAALRDLSVLTAGATPPNPQELLSRDGFRQLLAQAGAEYDVVLVDTPALADGAEAQTVAAQIGAALMLARGGHTAAAAFAGLRDALQVARSVVIGSVLTQF